MATAKANWYVGCSPRDPRKLLPEIKLLLNYDGQEWGEKQQKDFAAALAGLDTFEGIGYKKEPDFSTRDRVAKMKNYGFVYTLKKDGKDILHITDAGKEIISTKIPEEVFLKQMLKWQYPSFQHKSKNQYPIAKFLIRPFIFTTKLIVALGGITKAELAIFAFTTTKERNADAVIGEIKKYRAKRDAIVGKTKKLKFDYACQRKKFKKAYAKLLKGKKAEKLETRMRSAYDMADALVRHLRFTSLFTIHGNKVIVSENMKEIISWVTKQPITLNDEYANVEKFYAYMGNPRVPITPFDKKSKLITSIQAVHAEITTLSKGISHSIVRITPLPNSASMSVLQLKELLFMLLDEKKTCMKTLLEMDIRKGGSQKDVIDPATYLEWNMWRALLHIDDEEKIVPNFGMDSDLQPTGHAGGKKGDIEAYYKEFNLLAEVTLTSGERQANTEIEPVWRHVGNFQEKSSGKKTFGLFVAPKINPETPNHFFVMASSPLFNGKKVVTIPLSLDQFIDILQTAQSIRENRSKKLLQLWLSFEEEVGRHTDGVGWRSSFPKVIQRWKDSLST